MQNTGTQNLTVQKEEGGDLKMNSANSKKRLLDPQSPEDDDKNGGPEDEKTAKKQRRLVKNREAAAQFRHRQKAYMQKLEKHAEELSQSNIQVTAKIELLDTENKLMKEQLSYLRNFMKQAVALSFPNSLPSLPPDSVTPEVNPSHSSHPSHPLIPDLFPDDGPRQGVDSKMNIKMEPSSLVPDIANFTPSIVPTTSPSPSPTPMSMAQTLPLSPPDQISIPQTFITPPPMAPHSHIPTHTHTQTHTKPNPPLTSNPREAFITSTNLLADPYLAASTISPSVAPQPSLLTASALLSSSSPSPLLGSSMNLSGSASLSSIFNSILGTDLNFSGILVKAEPLDPPPPQP